MRKKTSPLVSVIMNNYNGSKFLKKSINSLLDQTYKNWELIFWDNCSTDESKKIVRNFDDKRIKFFTSKKYYPLYKSRNLAIAKAKGKYVCFLDTDDLWRKNKINLQVQKIEKFNGSIIYSNFIIKNIKNKKTYLRKKSPLPEGHITQKLFDDYFVGILTLMIKRSLFLKYRFGNKFEIIGDFDLVIRLSQKFKFYCIQDALSVYVLHGENYSIKFLKKEIDEMQKWIKTNCNKLKKDYSFFNLKFYYYKLILKNFLQTKAQIR